jgi:hypothetical protein
MSHVTPKAHVRVWCASCSNIKEFALMVDDPSPTYIPQANGGPCCPYPVVRIALTRVDLVFGGGR